MLPLCGSVHEHYMHRKYRERIHFFNFILFLYFFCFFRVTFKLKRMRRLFTKYVEMSKR